MDTIRNIYFINYFGKPWPGEVHKVICHIAVKILYILMANFFSKGMKMPFLIIQQS